MNLSELDFNLPEELIAQEPLPQRDDSRLLVLDRQSGAIEHRLVRDLPKLLRSGDRLVFNDARVIPARLRGKKESTGGRVELLVVSPSGGAGADRATWRCLAQASKPIRSGARIAFDRFSAVVTRVLADGELEVRFDVSDLMPELARAGEVPLPPYIRRSPSRHDRERYQTIYARVPGAVAAPTAGLHFTTSLFEALALAGIEKSFITLLVGPGTFLPIRSDNLVDHQMRAERGEISPTTVDEMSRTRQNGRRVVAVGTTVVRALEGSAERGQVRSGPFETDIFLVPGHSFSAIDALFTNFHLPRSTLIALVFAFAGRERVLAAYREAVEHRYRFYSYGDAMLIL